MQILSFALVLLISTPLVSAHFKIINATGDMGGNASALGVLAMDNSQNDVTKFKRKDDKSAGNLFGTLIQVRQHKILINPLRFHVKYKNANINIFNFREAKSTPPNHSQNYNKRILL